VAGAADDFVSGGVAGVGEDDSGEASFAGAILGL